eukprot:6197427-Pleurochrysis_carterae.AAC.2
MLRARRMQTGASKPLIQQRPCQLSTCRICNGRLRMPALSVQTTWLSNIALRQHLDSLVFTSFFIKFGCPTKIDQILLAFYAQDDNSLTASLQPSNALTGPDQVLSKQLSG